MKVQFLAMLRFTIPTACALWKRYFSSSPVPIGLCSSSEALISPNRQINLRCAKQKEGECRKKVREFHGIHGNVVRIHARWTLSVFRTRSFQSSSCYLYLRPYPATFFGSATYSSVLPGTSRRKRTFTVLLLKTSIRIYSAIGSFLKPCALVYPWDLRRFHTACSHSFWLYIIPQSFAVLQNRSTESDH